MFVSESEFDAGFYRLIHQLVGAQIIAPSRERRDTHRQPFSAVHRIAPIEGPGFPDDSAFFPVRCYDLTRSGFSFFMATRPEFTSLVIAFGNPPDVIYAAAEVTRRSDVLVHSSGLVEHIEGGTHDVGYQSPNGEAVTPMVLVGCHFTKRLERPSADGSD